jgi:hypothetical protein
MAISQTTDSQSSRGISRLITLVAGDAIVFLIFSAIGRNSHAEAAGFAALPQIIETAAPFMLGWFIVAPFTGAYRTDLTSTPRQMIGRTALTWLVAWPIGLGLRALIRQSGIPLTFAAITFITVLVLTGIWRLAFALVAKRTTQA